MSKRAVLLVNLGSPDSTSVEDVRAYLREFLMDGRVIDAPYPIRWCIVHLGVLPKRPAQSAEAYEKIWTPEGSPLVVCSKRVRAAVEKRSGVRIELAMRYQNPSIPDAVRTLREEGFNEILLIPLFPHFAMSSYETAVERVREVVRRDAPGVKLTVVPAYYDHPDYIRALVATSAEQLSQSYDHLLFSFHGVPERHLRKSDPSGRHDHLARECDATHCPTPETCYRHQCFKTAEAFVRAAGVAPEKFSVAFQSRLGRDPWLKPYTDHVLAELAQKGVRKLLVICPSFVTDCLETIEEIGLRGRETFMEAGGTEFQLIPCLNEHELWLEFLEKLARDFSGNTEVGAAPGSNIIPCRS